MKSRIGALLLAVVVGISLTACGSGAPLTTAGTEKEDASADDEYTVVVPDAVIHLSEEDEVLLNGELKNGVYINRYFGYKLSVPQGGTLIRDMDEATESTQIIPLRQAYEEEWGGLSFTAELEGVDGDITLLVSALDDDEVGLSEEELVKKNIEDMWEINRWFGEEDGPDLGTAMLAGEEHPVSVHITNTVYGDMMYASFYIPKGDFKFTIMINANTADATLEDLTVLFEKI